MDDACRTKRPLRTRRWRRSLAPALAVALLCVCSGCAVHRLRGPEAETGVESSRDWNPPLRKSRPGEKSWGFDSRAKEIERNLGFQ